MTSREELYRRFAGRFHAGKKLRPATDEQIATAEAALGVLWPEAYRQFAMTCGAIFTPSLLDLIVGRKLRFSDVQQFLTPKQSVTETKRWLLEPLGACLAFASDCSGNWLGFRDLQLPSRVDDAPVWLFDHDTGDIDVEAETFDAWLERFLSL